MKLYLQSPKHHHGAAVNWAPGKSYIIKAMQTESYFLSPSFLPFCLHLLFILVPFSLLVFLLHLVRIVLPLPKSSSSSMFSVSDFLFLLLYVLSFLQIPPLLPFSLLLFLLFLPHILPLSFLFRAHNRTVWACKGCGL